MQHFDVLIRNTSSVITADGPLGPDAERTLAPIPRGAIGIRDGKIAFLGTEAELPPDALRDAHQLLDAEQGFAGPGLVDPHTHLVFAGDRSREFEQRNQGASYLEIAAGGGGIAATVTATRAASEEALVLGALPRLARYLAQGVTTLEVKSGYGLDLDTELKMLRVVRTLSTLQPITLVPTLLCAHSLPPEFKADRERYVRLCIEEIIPAVADEGLAVACDAFVEESAFTGNEARRILTAARDRGLAVRLHVDQLTSAGGAELAVELGARSADHLEQISEAGLHSLVGSGITAVLAPTSTLFLRLPQYAPGRKLRDAGVEVALATNLNPGSSMSENVALAMGLGCLGNGLTAAEAYLGFTRSAASALGLPQAGRLVVGGPADVVVFSTPDYRHLPYQLGINQARLVLKAGRRVADSRSGPKPV